MEWRRHSRLPGVGASRIRWFALLAVVLAVVADALLLPVAVRAFVRGIELLMNACVWLALSISAGMSVWSIVRTAGGAVSGALTSRQMSVALTILVAVGALAAYGLQKMLGKEESPR